MKRVINCKKDALELAYGYDEEEKWKPIIRRSKIVRIPETKEIPTEEELTELSTVWAIMERDQVEIKDNSPLLDMIIEFPQAARSHSCDIFILDSGKEESERVGEKTGTAVIASFDDKPECLKKSDVGVIIPEGDEMCVSWEQFFRKVSISPRIPSNALVLIDRYMFAKSGGFSDESDDAIYNLEHILNSILPPKLAYEFQVLIVAQKPWKSDLDIAALYESFEAIRKRLKRPYMIVFELALFDLKSSIYGESHDRKIISNYFLGDFSHGFKVFSSNGKAKAEFQRLSYECIFNESDPGRFPFLAAHNAYLNLLHNFFKIEENNERYCSCYNNSGKLCDAKELKNRLLN